MPGGGFPDRRPVAHRVAPLCPYYTRCGGCRMQHIAYAASIGAQTTAGRRRSFAGSPSFSSPRGAGDRLPATLGYRGKAEFHLAGGRGGSRRVGLMALASHELVEIERCEIVEESINRKYGTFREALRVEAPSSSGRTTDHLVRRAGRAPDGDFNRFRDPFGNHADCREKRMAVPDRGIFSGKSPLVEGTGRSGGRR